ncbi:MAG: discoidin domain-containing protein [Angelakisella sp.]
MSLKRILAFLICVSMIVTGTPIAFAAVGEGKVNIGLEATASAYAEWKDNPASFAFDGDKSYNKRWASEAGAPGYLKATFFSEKNIGEFRITWEENDNCIIKDYHIEDAAGNTIYTAATVTENTIGKPRIDEILLDNPVATTEIKLCIDEIIAGYQSIGVQEFEIYEASSVLPDNMKNLALNLGDGAYLASAAYPTMPAKMAFDGDIGLNSRWSTEADAPGWIQANLGGKKDIYQMRIVWEYWDAVVVKNYHIEVSDTGVDGSWRTIYTAPVVETPEEGRKDVITLPSKVTAQYIKLVVDELARGNNVSAQEFEVFGLDPSGPVEPVDPANNLQEALTNVMKKAPTISGSKLILPETGSDKFGVRLFGCSNKAVIADDLTITKPLQDMTINVFYEVYEIADDTKTLHSNDPKTIVVKGTYTPASSINEKPNVVPGLREWKGNEGDFSFSGSLVIGSEKLRETADMVANYLNDMVDIQATVKKGTPGAGDIFFKLDKSSTVGAEGYTMDIADILTVVSPTAKGALYAGSSITQILYQYGSIPKGLVRDYPQYEIRSVMLDVARLYTPLPYLEEVTRYASFFKINEMHVHINDSDGEQEGAFRVESKRFPKINQGIITYSQDDYRKYQKDAKNTE